MGIPGIKRQGLSGKPLPRTGTFGEGRRHRREDPPLPSGCGKAGKNLNTKCSQKSPRALLTNIKLGVITQIEQGNRKEQNRTASAEAYVPVSFQISPGSGSIFILEKER